MEDRGGVCMEFVNFVNMCLVVGILRVGFLVLVFILFMWTLSYSYVICFVFRSFGYVGGEVGLGVEFIFVSRIERSVVFKVL